MCIKAISRGDRFAGTALRDIPDDVKTPKMCELAVEISPWSLQYVPDELVTEEMLRTVTRMACGRLTDNFPERFRTKEFIDSLIEIDPHCANYLLKYLE